MAHSSTHVHGFVSVHEVRILIEETLEDLTQLMLINNIATELLEEKETKK